MSSVWQIGAFAIVRRTFPQRRRSTQVSGPAVLRVAPDVARRRFGAVVPQCCALTPRHFFAIDSGVVPLAPPNYVGALAAVTVLSLTLQELGRLGAWLPRSAGGRHIRPPRRRAAAPLPFVPTSHLLTRNLRGGSVIDTTTPRKIEL
jgi:hypothetical protein